MRLRKTSTLACLSVQLYWSEISKMCIVTILHCTPCKFRQDMPAEGLIIKKDWHAQLLVNIDCDNIPFRRCVNATNHALSNGRSDTMYPRCRNVEVKHMPVKKDICYRCSTRRRIQKLIAVRKVYEQQTATWRDEGRRDTEAMNDTRRSIRESSRRILTTGNERISGVTASSIIARHDSISLTSESWDSCLERQILQREIAKAKEAERQARLAEEAGVKKKRAQDRLAAVQQRLIRMNRLGHFPIMQENAEQGLDNEQVPGPGPLQDAPASPKRPSSAMPLIVSSDMADRHAFKVRFPTLGVTSATKSNGFDGTASDYTAMVSAAGSASVRGFSALRAEAPEFASLRGILQSSRTSSLRAQAPEFKPLRHTPPVEPRMMRAPTAPRAMREGSLSQASDKPRQKYAIMRGYPTLRGWQE